MGTRIRWHDATVLALKLLDSPVYASFASSLCYIIHPRMTKEGYSMYDGILALMGTTEEEIVAKATKSQQEKIERLSDENTILRALLAEHNIPLPAQKA